MVDKLNRRIEVNLMRTVNLGNYESVKAGVVLSQNIPDSAEENVEYEALWEIAEKQLNDYLSAYEQSDKVDEDNEIIPDQPLEDEVEKKETEQEEVFEDSEIDPVEEDEEGEELDISEEDINKMTKSELTELCKTTEGMEDIDLNLNLKPLRATIIDLLFEEEEEVEIEEEAPDEETTDSEETELDESGGEWDQDDWQDE